MKDLIVGLLKLSEFIDDDDDDDNDDVSDDVNDDVMVNRMSVAKYRNGLTRNGTNSVVYCSDCGRSGYGSSSGNSSSMEVSDSSEGTSPTNIGMGNICMMSKRAKVMTDKSNSNSGNGDYYCCCRCRCDSCGSLSPSSSSSSYYRRRDGYFSGSGSNSGSGSGSASPMEIGAPLNGPSGLLSPGTIPSATFSSLPSSTISLSSVGMPDFSSRGCSESPVRCRSCGNSCGVISDDGIGSSSICGGGERGIGGGYLRGKGSLGANDNRMRLLNNYDCVMPLSSSSSPPARTLL